MGKWVTIKGAHVYIEDDGSVSKGPKSFIKKTVNERLDEEFNKGNITRQQYEKAKTFGWSHSDLDRAVNKNKMVKKAINSKYTNNEEGIDKFAEDQGITRGQAKTYLDEAAKQKNFIKSPAQKSVDALNEIDRLAGDNEYLQKKGRELGLAEFKNYLKKNPGLRR